jgi:MoaA/NifB/PqqE/SkfB family radical SAM enzyme
MTIWSYFRGPDIFDIKVGYGCNNACIHCIVDPVRRRIHHDGSPENLDTAQVEELIEAAIVAGARTVVMTGGEVTLRPDCERLLHYATERGLRVVLQTNGRMLSRPDLCKRLAALPSLLFIVALHGSQPRTHDAITRRRSSFNETCAAIQNLRADGGEVVVKLVLLKQNQGDVLATIKRAVELGACRFCLVFPHASEFSKSHFQRIIACYTDLQSDIRSACLYAEEQELFMSFENFPYCTVPDHPGFWERNCDLRSMTAAPRTSKVNQQGHLDWDILRRTMKEKRQSCRICAFDPICEGPWREYVRVYSFAEFVPVRIDAIDFYCSAHGTSSLKNGPDIM